MNIIRMILKMTKNNDILWTRMIFLCVCEMKLENMCYSGNFLTISTFGVETHPFNMSVELNRLYQESEFISLNTIGDT